MSNLQGEQFIDLLFAQNKGIAAVAAKNGAGGAWAEQTFRWPEDRELLLSWAHANKGGDVFICPALRKSQDRMKNDGAHLQWMWADVDFQDVPEDKVSLVQRRINKISSMVISSGSGDNVHVYVKLPKAQTLDIWRRLNAGLRDYLYADAKHTDNALLRIPGTINRKPDGGRVRIKQEFNGKTADVQRLLENAVWKRVVITDDKGVNDGAYDKVDVSHLLRGEIRRRVSMEVDEARGRYGTRHGAVYQVASWLSKKGLTGDQIHTLMAEFPAGVDKELEERGYSLHVDIDRCLSANPTVEALEIVEDVLEVVETDEPDESLTTAARKRVRALDVEDLARQMRAQRAFMPPPIEVSYRWSDHIAKERPPLQYAVESIAAVGQNVTITGQYKAGKTLLGVNLIRCLVDGDSFLGEFKVGEHGGASVEESSVGFWSLEMSMSDLDGYIDPIGLERADRLVVLSGRGYGVNILTDVGKQWTVNWLQDGGVRVWVVDSHARMCRMAGVDENDNGAVLGLLHRLDEIKEIAGVEELFYLVHTGRAEQQDGRERARGATVIDDWADARWVLTREGEARFLMVEGRSVVDMTATSLNLDKETGRISLGSRNKYGARVDGLVAVVESIVKAAPGELNMRALRKKVRESVGEGGRSETIAEAIQEAIDTGFIREEKVSGREKRYWTGEGKEFDFSKIDRDFRARGSKGKRGGRKGNKGVGKENKREDDD